ncbi:NAD(P)/FAD-dependent oxidoreductase [Chitinimonas koreensis]|uniref:NAD(P)/FAD-dependent oxidoreductase n=1 Tax=Chitinimonas koreensis TaxID=356302 RepID=UPI00041A1B6B|nr:FAD-dependent oxidoreductase [Chitinimonas koreensis]QNM95320.1 FAD-dependent oxidoreductase [Chitinimonas koreensis]
MQANTSFAAGSRIAVVGAGIAGLSAAYLLSRRYAVSLFEKGSYLGGHTNSVDLNLDGQVHPVDTGFLVFNDRTYPNLVALFEELGVQSHASDMSFSVSIDDGAMEWAGSNLDTVFAQRRNLVSPRFLGMLRDIVRFNRLAQANLAAARQSGETLGHLLRRQGFGRDFADRYLIPMAAAIWSSPAEDILGFPAASFLQFCQNHGLLQIHDRPQWRTVSGGGKAYVARMAAAIPDIRLACPVSSVRRDAAGVRIEHAHGVERFDAIVLAGHAPDSLSLLHDPGDDEREVLGAVRYQDNVAWLHSDPALLPRRRKAWSAWNYLGRTEADGRQPVCVSYLINRLQPLPFERPVVVTLNPFARPAEHLAHCCFHYAHPLLDAPAVAAQQRLPGLQGRRRTWYAGAWTGYGFHEDGLKSALRVAADFGLQPAWARC